MSAFAVMSDSVSATKTSESDLSVPMPDVVRFVRQLSHDLRNHLNAAELQSAYVNELAGDAELKSELQRLRAMLSEMGRTLQAVTNLLAPVKLTEMPYEASGFVEDLRQTIEQEFAENSRAIEWQIDPGAALVQIDPQLFQQALLQLIANAFQHGRGSGNLCAKAEVKAGEFIFILSEPKESFTGPLENWGREPFHHLGRGHYGLGLHRTRNIIEAHHGRLEVRYDQPSASLVTTVALPLAETA